MKIVKHFIFWGLLLVICFPAVQKKYELFPERPLKGAVKYAPKPELSWTGWLSGQYQDDFDTYLEEHIGFRPFFIQLYNQIDFSLFREVHARAVVLGKKGYFFEKPYIEAYTGRDYMGDEKISRKAGLTHTLQDYLRQKGTLLLPVFIPGKASFFPEYIPNRLLRNRRPKTNEKELKKAFDSLGVEYLDLDSWYLAKKDTSRYPLYPQCGIHWSDYGVSLVMDTLISYMQKRLGKPMVSFYVESYDRPDTLRGNDYDIAEGMNLFFQPAFYPMVYPNYHFIEGPDRYKPAVLTLADSYYWRLFATGLVKRFFRKNSFRYYNNRQYEFGDTQGHYIDHLYWEVQVKKYDFVLLMFTEANLKKYAYGFLEEGEYERKYGNRGKEVFNSILYSEERLKQVREEAERREITVEEMIRTEAARIINEEQEKTGAK